MHKLVSGTSSMGDPRSSYVYSTHLRDLVQFGKAHLALVRLHELLLFYLRLLVVLWLDHQPLRMHSTQTSAAATTPHKWPTYARVLQALQRQRAFT